MDLAFYTRIHAKHKQNIIKTLKRHAFLGKMGGYTHWIASCLCCTESSEIAIAKAELFHHWNAYLDLYSLYSAEKIDNLFHQAVDILVDHCGDHDAPLWLCRFYRKFVIGEAMGVTKDEQSILWAALPMFYPAYKHIMIVTKMFDQKEMVVQHLSQVCM